MEIKRKINILSKTDRRFIIRSSQNVEQINCAKCESKMRPSEKVAILFGIRQRKIFRLIEENAVHFNETETSLVMVCLSSMSAVLTQDHSNLKAKNK